MPVQTVIMQNLPAANVKFRKEQVRAVRDDIVNAAHVALMTYSGDVDENWTRYVIPRKGVILGKCRFVFLMRVDPNKKIIEIAIRGSDNLDDAARDLDIGAVQDARLNVPLHAGFQSVAVGVLEKLKTVLTVEQFETSRVSTYGTHLEDPLRRLFQCTSSNKEALST